MTLTLTITNVEKLDNGVSTRLRLDRHGAVIGRSPQADWSLPDPQHYISSTHCEIDYRDGVYMLADKSTNGAFINGSETRPTGPHPIRDGDQILIGPYQIAAQLDPDADAAAAALSGAAAQQAGAASDWGGWDSHAGSAAVAPAVSPSAGGWGEPAAQPAISGMGAMSGHWAPPSASAPTPPPPVSSVWAQPAAAPSPPASGWSSPVSEPSADPSAADVWGKLAEGNTVDWARGGFGAPAPAPVLAPTPTKDPLGLGGGDVGGAAASGWGAPTAAAAVAPSAVGANAGWGASAPARPAAPPPQAPAPPPAATSPSSGGEEWAAFLDGAGVAPADIKAAPREAMAGAGALLRRLTAGMVVMMEARARAKAQLGAQSTMLEFDGNNPLKFARSPEKALAQLLSAPERGFMPADRAVEDAFRDLQAHQMATLAAMQGALAATLARFSPQSIRDRAEMRGVLAKILPSARDAEMWKAYEREFEGVARGSDEAFMDIFAKEFKTAYEKSAADLKARG